MIGLSGTAGQSGGGDPSRSVGEYLRQMFVSGAAITIPLIVTVIVLSFVVNFIFRTISPFVAVVENALGVGSEVPPVAIEVLSAGLLVGLILLVGFVAETSSGSGFEDTFDAAMARIPGIGSVYTSFNEMSELLLSNDTQSFREVKLVEFPVEGSFTVGFVTAETPDAFVEATGTEEMQTLFVPMAPNPVMGGFVVHISSERIHDVELTVEQGIRSIVTSGVATADSTDDIEESEVIDLGTLREQAAETAEGLESWGARTAGDISDLAVVTAEDIQAIKRQTKREIAAVHPDLDPDDVEEPESDDPKSHYMIDPPDSVPTADDPLESGESADDGGDDTSGEGGDSG